MIDEAFGALLRPSDLIRLDRSESIGLAFWPDGRIAYFNPAYKRHARDNGGGSDFCVRWGIGRNLFDAISPALLGFYQDAFRRVVATGEAWTHDYECPTPHQRQRYRMRMHGVARKALLASHTLFWTAPHDSAPRAAGGRFADRAGLVAMCASCRNVRVPASEPERWVCVPDLIADPPETISYGLCPTCLIDYMT